MPTLGLMVDPGLPEKVATLMRDALARSLTQHLGERSPDAGPQDGAATGPWRVALRRQTLALAADGSIPLLRRAATLRDGEDWDLVIYLTDLPLQHDGVPMLGQAGTRERAALVSLPTLGVYRVRARLRELLEGLARALDRDAPPPGDPISLGRRRYRVIPAADGQWYLVSDGLGGRWHLLSGMVRSNRPGRLLTALSNSVAAAVATGAFGIFYASVWRMADALSPARLAIISVLAVGVMSGWLILHNRLWNRSRRFSDSGQARRDNASTLATITISVIMMYVLLFVLLLSAALIIIEASYLRSDLGHPVSALDYLKLSWLAASLGTMAGAVGSNFDSDAAIREATYSRREHERRRLAKSPEDG